MNLTLFYLISVIILTIIIYLILLFKYTYENKDDVQEADLLEAVKEADLYEIVYLKGGEPHLIAYIVYNLIKNNYLIKVDGKFEANTAMVSHLELLKEPEKAIYCYIKDHPEDFNGLPYKQLSKHVHVLKPIVVEYKKKFDRLALLNIFSPLENTFFNAYSIYLFIVPLFVALFSITHLMKCLFEFCGIYIVNILIAIFILSKINLFFERMTVNGKKYLELFEHHQHPVPDIKNEYLKFDSSICSLP